MGNLTGNAVVDKNILDVLQKHPGSEVEISKVKISPKKKIQKQKIVQKKSAKKMTKVVSMKPDKELKKQVKALTAHVKKRESALSKRHTALEKRFQEHTAVVQRVGQDVLETKAHYAHIPKLTLETQMMIESMNKLTAVVKQLLVLFNEKISKEEGPLFSKLDQLMEQNEKIAEGLLAVADIVKGQQTPKAPIREINPFMQRTGPAPLPLRPQMPSSQEFPEIPSDLGKFQYPETSGQQQLQPQPIPQYSAPLPPFSPLPMEEMPQEQGVQEPLPSRKRMLF